MVFIAANFKSEIGHHPRWSEVTPRVWKGWIWVEHSQQYQKISTKSLSGGFRNRWVQISPRGSGEALQGSNWDETEWNIWNWKIFLSKLFTGGFSSSLSSYLMLRFTKDAREWHSRGVTEFGNECEVKVHYLPPGHVLAHKRFFNITFFL